MKGYKVNNIEGMSDIFRIGLRDPEDQEKTKGITKAIVKKLIILIII